MFDLVRDKSDVGINMKSLIQQMSDQNFKQCDLENLVCLSLTLVLGATSLEVDFLILSVVWYSISPDDKLNTWSSLIS